MPNLLITGISKSSVNKYRARYASTGNVRLLKSPGKQKKLTADQQTVLATTALNNNFASTRTLLSFMDDAFPTICRSTIRSYLKASGVKTRIAANKPQMSSDAVASRLRIARESINRPTFEHFLRTLFIDEFTIDTRKYRKKFVKRLDGQRYLQQNCNEYRLTRPKSLSFVASFCAKGMGPLALVDGRLNKEQYLSYLHHNALPYGRRMYPEDDFFLLHDNCPIHTARDVTEYLRIHMRGRVLPHPAYSPDLNPIENIERKLRERD